MKNRVLVLIGGLALVKLAIHLATNAFGGYGIFRDELYYIACSNRPAAGYVDQPPLSIYLLSLSRMLFGESLFALRLLPAVAAAAAVFFTGLMVRRLGGAAVAVTLALLALIFTPLHLGMCSFYSMNSFDWFFWSAAGFTLIRLCQRGESRDWLIMGLVLGLGCLNKVGMLWFGFGLFIALLATPLRRHLRTPWPYVAAVLALILFSPFLIWNAANGFPHIEFMRNATQYKYASLTRLDFVLGQLLIINPLHIVLALAGLGHYLFSRTAAGVRAPAWIFLSVFAILLFNPHSKPEYLGPAYPMLFAAGGVLAGELCRRRFWGWLRIAAPSLIVISGLAILPMALPVLPVETFLRYASTIGVNPPSAEGHDSELPQHYADRFGWEEMAAVLSEIYLSLPERERATTVIYAQNYGEAGAVEYYSSDYPLPPVISPHNSFWYWWDLDAEVSTIIIIGGNVEDHLDSLERVEQAATIRCRFCVPYENDLPVYIGRGLIRSVREIHGSDRHFI